VPAGVSAPIYLTQEEITVLARGLAMLADQRILATDAASAARIVYNPNATWPHVNLHDMLIAQSLATMLAELSQVPGEVD